MAEPLVGTRGLSCPVAVFGTVQEAMTAIERRRPFPLDLWLLTLKSVEGGYQVLVKSQHSKVFYLREDGLIL